MDLNFILYVNGKEDLNPNSSRSSEPEPGTLNVQCIFMASEGWSVYL